jgi:hypothetical protein
MTTRLTVDQFFDAIRERGVYPLVDTAEARAIVQRNVKALCSEYPIKDRWPVLDLESAYEAFLNAQPNLLEWHRNGYRGTIRAGDFDDTYTLDEWFGDFTRQWSLRDTPDVRAAMLALLPRGGTWRSPELYAAHKKVVESMKYRIASWLFR